MITAAMTSTRVAMSDRRGPELGIARCQLVLIEKLVKLKVAGALLVETSSAP